MTEAEVLRRVRRAADAAGGQSAWARQLGCSSAFVGGIIDGRREPSGKVLAAVGIRAQWVKHFEEAPDG